MKLDSVSLSARMDSAIELFCHEFQERLGDVYSQDIVRSAFADMLHDTERVGQQRFRICLKFVSSCV